MKPLARLAATLLSLLLLLSGAAGAAGTATATLSNLQLGALDLTPLDGHAAGFTVDTLSTSLGAYVFWPEDGLSDELQPDPYRPGSVSVQYGPSGGTAATSGAPGNLSTSSSAHANLGDYGFTGGFADQLVWLTLRPHTVLTVGGHFDTFAERTVEQGRDFDAYNEIVVQIADENFNIVTSLWRTSNVFPGSDPSETLDEDFTLAYANGSDSDLLVSLYLSAWSDVITLPAVPEPTVPAMLCAGLLVIGMAARGRRAGSGSAPFDAAPVSA
ncbi:putative secreted protein with PEP-CTERM sorting signal [Pseudoduganella lurida]|uniref:Putative secreted protein with PEP-CTERM sorting signal n=1 Tax=Pseudoduganella lurida TaxID=1036180 RepID=A0A562QVE1_9BURK|nr:hypothetical protein [Pseudoduganella lurida]TWI60727.1 putative secreted protein with PEP-CTERM sorting signal [Pseudoduganella lurida]